MRPLCIANLKKNFAVQLKKSFTHFDPCLRLNKLRVEPFFQAIFSEAMNRLKMVFLRCLEGGETGIRKKRYHRPITKFEMFFCPTCTLSLCTLSKAVFFMPLNSHSQSLSNRTSSLAWFAKEFFRHGSKSGNIKWKEFQNFFVAFGRSELIFQIPFR